MKRALYSLTGFKLAFITARLLPRPWCRWIAPQIAAAIYRQAPSVQAALRANLGLVTGKSGAALDRLCTENVRNFSQMLADYFLCAGMDAVAQSDRLLEEWSGFENLQAARANGRGAIIVTAHLGHWELGGITLARRGLPLTVVTLEEPSSDLTRWREACRRHLGIKTIAVGPGHPFAFVEMIQTLRRNELLAMLVDRPYPGSGAAVNFFGRETEFSTAPALLAQHTGAAVLPAFVLQKPNGLYASVAAPLIPMAAAEDHHRGSLAANTQHMATIFESIIREHPEQWFNYVPIWHSPDAVAAGAASSEPDAPVVLKPLATSRAQRIDRASNSTPPVAPIILTP